MSRLQLTIIHADEIQHVIELVDSIGGPQKLDISGFICNPSTLRYVAIALLLLKRFGRKFPFLSACRAYLSAIDTTVLQQRRVCTSWSWVEASVAKQLLWLL